ncbi:MAG: efflux RND transporter periplasmic adaptor subunit [Candidatus Eisenbacteria sp.]|nr:efflux RND transporter periplasmic adaptor subunit [Candidatus Eisenbacteria bacterium]
MTDGQDVQPATRILKPAVAVLCLLMMLALPFLLGACGDRSAQAGAENSAATESGADSLAAGDGSPADSSAATRKESKKGLFARIFGGKKDKNEEEEEPVPVRLAIAGRQDVPLYLSATATLEAESQADILAKIAGEIRSIEAEEGDWVREGQILAVLDGEVQRVALKETEARVRAFRLDLDRVASLHEQDLASEKQFNDAQFRYEEAEAQRLSVQLQMDYTRIVAPFSGRITQRFTNQGQTVSAGTRIFSIVDPDPLLARIHLPEKEARRISPKQEVVVRPDADPDRTFPGEVLRVSPMVDPRTGTVKTTCQVAGQTSDLRPGSFVRVKIRTDVHPGALVIPKRSLVPEGGETYVFKAEEDTVVKVPVSTGYADGTVIEIMSGLEEGDRIVTVGQGGLKTGSKFREITEDSVTVTTEMETE